MGRFDPATTDQYSARLDPPATITLAKRVSGVDTDLDTAAFVMPQLSDPPSTVKLSMTGTAITVLVNGTPTLSATDASVAAAGNAGITGNRSVGQPVHISNLEAQ